ncbi:sulfite exporter TauE/SafE family protein [Glycomyces luteolus]|uniref:Probable membrane transporter protein n=1 Tax=Glycomyces luteolus TaxID=2670330 RepID=A0A9X3PDC1_9ACTN|nr:sulfite exporter TauE/SafE family protein [Glycomyces luteolus]MDA1361448.1 sulfite exporter TauE/SafE family protein [Glycomyces luteolus]
MSALPDGAAAWAVLALAAVLVGIAKTGFSGMGSLPILLFATVLPAKESTGALLPMLILADLFAIRFYSRHVEWRVLARLAPWVVVGTVIGAVVLWFVDDTLMRLLIGAILLVMLAIQVWNRVRPKAVDPEPSSGLARRSAAAGAGVAAGATTMMANAAGPVMVLYLMLSGFPKLRFLGTMAWFFFAVNLFKVPFSVGLGLISWHTLLMAALLIPAVALGALIGRAVVHRVNQRQFEIATLALSAVGAGLLVLSAV